MADEDIDIPKSGKGKLMIIIVAILIVVLGAGGAYFFLFTDDESAVSEGDAPMQDEVVVEDVVNTSSLDAMYVGMPRPFTFNVPGQDRERLVQIKVQLLVRGIDNENMARTHIPLIEGTLLQVFSATNASELSSASGKESLKIAAVREVKRALKEITGSETVEKVLFTGFVMQ